MPRALLLIVRAHFENSVLGIGQVLLAPTPCVQKYRAKMLTALLQHIAWSAGNVQLFDWTGQSSAQVGKVSSILMSARGAFSSAISYSCS